MADQAGTTRVADATLHWRRDGSGPAIVFVHGFPLSGETWESVVARLRDRFTCYAPDVIGFGESSSPVAADYAAPAQARAWQALLSQLGVASYALVGNDSGGWIARELALIDRERVSRLILTNTEIPGHRPPWIPLYQVLAHAPGAGILFQQLLKLRAFRRSSMGFGGCFTDLSLLDGDFFERFIAPLIASPARMEGAMEFLRRMTFTRLDEFRTLHAQLGMPVLFIWGADDPTFPEVRARAMLPQFPNVAGFHAVANTKLFLYAERPQAVADLIAGFLA